MACSVRSGMFLTTRGQELLSDILNEKYNTVTTERLHYLSADIGRRPPNRYVLLKKIEGIARTTDLLDYEFRVMDAIRDAFYENYHHRNLRKNKELQCTKSVISETTAVGSTFSHASD